MSPAINYELGPQRPTFSVLAAASGIYVPLSKYDFTSNLPWIHFRHSLLTSITADDTLAFLNHQQPWFSPFHLHGVLNRRIWVKSTCGLCIFRICKCTTLWFCFPSWTTFLFIFVCVSICLIFFHLLSFASVFFKKSKTSTILVILPKWRILNPSCAWGIPPYETCGKQSSTNAEEDSRCSLSQCLGARAWAPGLGSPIGCSAHVWGFK